jgi:acetyltransferase-like isoleucine patch superfamily enzyme
MYEVCEPVLNRQKLNALVGLLKELREGKREEYSRCLPLGDLLTDRWEKAQFLGFGEGASIYDSAIVIGDVSVGENSWIGPNVMMDGSGGLSVGAHCSISMNVQIYSHDTVSWAVSGGVEPYEYASTKVGNNCYIGPNTVIQKGVTIGNGVVIGANSFVNIDLPDGSRAAGSPVRIIGDSD